MKSMPGVPVVFFFRLWVFRSVFFLLHPGYLCTNLFLTPVAFLPGSMHLLLCIFTARRSTNSTRGLSLV